MMRNIKYHVVRILLLKDTYREILEKRLGSFALELKVRFNMAIIKDYYNLEIYLGDSVEY